MTEVVLQINGQERQVSAAPTTTLLTVLREQLALTGAKRGCNQGVCGACTVMLDGEPVRACLSLAANCEGRAVTTVEGLSTGGAVTALQQAIIDRGAVQCGFCTAGMLITAQAFLRRNSAPSVEDVREALSGNICRCSGYRKIVEAVCQAAGVEP